MNFDRATLEALHRVAMDPSLEPFRKYLETRRAEARDRLELTQDVYQMSRAQGSAMELKQVIEDIRGAKQRLEKAVR